MFSRCLALLVVPVLPVLPFMLPLGPVHTINAVVAGGLATALALFSLADDRARLGTAIVGAWVALAGFIFPSTLVEEIVCICWGTATIVLTMGPFAGPPRIIRVPAAVHPRPAPPEEQLPLAA